MRNCCSEYILPEVIKIPGTQVLHVHHTADVIAREPQPKAALATGKMNFGKQNYGEMRIWLRTEFLNGGMDGLKGTLGTTT